MPVTIRDTDPFPIPVRRCPFKDCTKPPTLRGYYGAFCNGHARTIRFCDTTRWNWIAIGGIYLFALSAPQTWMDQRVLHVTLLVHIATAFLALILWAVIRQKFEFFLPGTWPNGLWEDLQERQKTGRAPF